MRSHHLLPALAVLLVAGCERGPGTEPQLARDGPAASAGASSPVDVGGTWVHTETVWLTFAGLAAPAFGVAPEGPVLHVTCEVVGTLTLDQDGSTFTGTLTFDDARTACRTKGGQTASAPWANPYTAAISGSVTGHALHFDQVEPDGIVCPKNGSATVVDGIATRLDIRGRCDLSAFPFRPASARNASTETRP